MARALELAERGRGDVEPNPLGGAGLGGGGGRAGPGEGGGGGGGSAGPTRWGGAVLVAAGGGGGGGWHRRYGEAHAEVNALAAAGDAARDATLYVTLEPCCHHGKTPPCADAILAAGVGRVVAATPDPFPQVAGRGITILRGAGVTVEVGEGGAAARDRNRPYLTLVGRGRPYVHAKWAMSLDGKIATRTGRSKWISGKSSRHRVHELRGRMDAI